MTQNEYLESLQKKFESYFDIERNIFILGKMIDIHAKFCDIRGRTLITKSDIIDRCENYEYCYIKRFDSVTEEEVIDYGEFLKQIVSKFVKPGNSHMSTYVTGVIVSNSISSSAKKAIEGYSCSRVYSFYLKGWCDVRLIYIGVKDNEIITNKAGRKVQKVYRIAQ